MNKTKWHKCATALLVRLAKNLGIKTSERKIHSNKGGPAVGGEVTMSAPEYGIYIHLHCPVDDYGEEDLIGGNYIRRANINDPYGTGVDKVNHPFQYVTEARLAEICKRIAGRSEE